MHERHDPSQRRLVWPPSPGYFRLRLAKNAWAVPAKITHEDGFWQATVDECVHPEHEDPAIAIGVPEIWHGGIIIEEWEYEFLLATKFHAAAHGLRNHPSLNPMKAMEPMLLEPILPYTGEST